LDLDQIGVSRLYAAYLEEMAESAAVVILQVHDRYAASTEPEV
jgi:hypothetical protein